MLDKDYYELFFKMAKLIPGLVSVNQAKFSCGNNNNPCWVVVFLDDDEDAIYHRVCYDTHGVFKLIMSESDYIPSPVYELLVNLINK